MQLKTIAGMRAMSEKKMAERQRKAARGMRAMTNEEIAEKQKDGLQNIFPLKDI